MEYPTKEDKTVEEWYNQFDGRKDISLASISMLFGYFSVASLIFASNFNLAPRSSSYKTSNDASTLCDVVLPNCFSFFYYLWAIPVGAFSSPFAFLFISAKLLLPEDDRQLPVGNQRVLRVESLKGRSIGY